MLGAAQAGFPGAPGALNSAPVASIRELVSPRRLSRRTAPSHTPAHRGGQKPSNTRLRPGDAPLPDVCAERKPRQNSERGKAIGQSTGTFPLWFSLGDTSVNLRRFGVRREGAGAGEGVAFLADRQPIGRGIGAEATLAPTTLCPLDSPRAWATR